MIYFILSITCIFVGLFVGYFFSKYRLITKPQGNIFRLSQSNFFELDMAPEKALPLFTAIGETLWIPSWKPVILEGDGFKKGTFFVTHHTGHTTYWLTVDYDEQAKRARHVRVTPGVDMGVVEVLLNSNETGGSRVNVSYELTALSQSGAQKLKGTFDEKSYAQMMKSWKDMIDSCREEIDHYFSKAG